MDDFYGKQPAVEFHEVPEVSISLITSEDAKLSESFVDIDCEGNSLSDEPSDANSMFIFNGASS